MSVRTFSELLTTADGPLGTWIKLPAIETVELIALGGFDFVVLDLEHSSMSLQTAATLGVVARSCGLMPLVRTPDRSQSWIQRSLDSGAAGVFVPHIDTGPQAADALASARHAPAGRRGVGPTTRAGAWGMGAIADYLDQSADAAVVAQLESPTAISNAAEIAAAGVNALFVGAADLSIAMGLTAADERVQEAMLHALEVAHGAGLPCGIAVGDANAARRLADRGFDFVMVSNDATMLGVRAQQIGAQYRASH